MEKKPLLELKQIIKEFSGTRALDGVNLKAFGGEVIAILGENGAGKSTLMKVLSGVWPTGSFSGEIQMGGHSRSFQDPRDAMAAGIAMIHQELSVFQELSIAEHLELDQLPRWIQWDELFVRTQKFLDSLGFGTYLPEAGTASEAARQPPRPGRGGVARAWYHGYYPGPAHSGSLGKGIGGDIAHLAERAGPHRRADRRREAAAVDTGVFAGREQEVVFMHRRMVFDLRESPFPRGSLHFSCHDHWAATAITTSALRRAD
jgi:ABC-type Fe3+/spermidine/putrescine transport system ATPase subunit